MTPARRGAAGPRARLLDRAPGCRTARPAAGRCARRKVLSVERTGSRFQRRDRVLLRAGFLVQQPAARGSSRPRAGAAGRAAHATVRGGNTLDRVPLRTDGASRAPAGALGSSRAGPCAPPPVRQLPRRFVRSASRPAAPAPVRALRGPSGSSRVRSCAPRPVRQLPRQVVRSASRPAAPTPARALRVASGSSRARSCSPPPVPSLPRQVVLEASRPAAPASARARSRAPVSCSRRASPRAALRAAVPPPRPRSRARRRRPR